MGSFCSFCPSNEPENIVFQTLSAPEYSKNNITQSNPNFNVVLKDEDSLLPKPSNKSSDAGYLDEVLTDPDDLQLFGE